MARLTRSLKTLQQQMSQQRGTVRVGDEIAVFELKRRNPSPQNRSRASKFSAEAIPGASRHRIGHAASGYERERLQINPVFRQQVPSHR